MKRILILLMAAILALVPEIVRAETQVNGRDSILILHSYSPDFAWTRSQQEGIDAVFTPLADKYDLRIEYLDAVYHPELVDSPIVLDLLRAKLAGKRFRAVLTTDNVAFNFARKHRTTLFIDAPVIFTGLNGYEDSMLRGEKGITGVAEDTDMQATVKLILQLRPETRRIVFPGMMDDFTYRASKPAVEAFFPSLPQPVEAVFPEYPNIDAAIDDLRNLPPDSAIIVMSTLRTRGGEGVTSQRVVELFSTLPIPVFTNWDFTLGHGVVGGSVISGVEQGRIAADIAVRVLGGEPPESIPVHRGAGKTYLFDHRQLARFDIPASRLPPGASVLFMPERTLRIAPEAAWIAGGSFTALLAMTISLVVSVRRRRRSEEQVLTLNQELEQRVADRTAQLAEARQRADTANKAKSIFLSNMSHELRTPLNAILGFSDILRRDPRLVEDQKETLAVVYRSGDHLLGLINDVLDIAKIEAGRIVLEPAPFDFGGMIADVTEMLRLRAGDKGLQLLLDQSSRFPRFIVGDETKLRQVLTNLISNAINATEQGGVTLRLGVRHNEVEHLRIEVEDTGIGISPADQAKLFQPFVQIGSPSKQQGTGLGLAITRQFVELMGGSISLTSAEGQGSTFRVELPVRLARPDEICQAPKARGEVTGIEPGQPDCRVLVVEDQADNQVLLRRLLERVGFEVRLAQNGAEAVEQFTSWQPQFICMDRRMPVMDGLEAARRIRSLPGGEAVKIAAVTASTFREEDMELTAAGFDAIVHKPFRGEQIFECMEQLLGLRFVRVATEEPDAPMIAAADVRVLIVDDDRDSRFLTKKVLEKSSFTLREAAGGPEAIQIFEEWQPHVVLMDMHMPGMDGMETTRHLRTLSGGDKTLIVALTAGALDEQRAEFIAAGGDDVTIKPIELKKVQALTAKFLGSIGGAIAPIGQLPPDDLPEALNSQPRDAAILLDATEATIGPEAREN